MIYLDSSALAKLVIKEAESAALEAWLIEHASVSKASSALARIEVPRAVRAGGDIALLRAQMVLGDLLHMPLTPHLLDSAGALPGSLRSLDAIHLASAMKLRADLTAFVAYDKRLLAAADEVGLPIASPGTS